MSGASFKMDFSGANQVLGKAITRVANRQQLSETLGEQLVSSTLERFEDETGPDGKAWKKSRRAKQEGGQTLSDKGNLEGSINYEATPASVAVGTTDKVKGAAHQFGATIKPKKGKALRFKTPDGFVITKKVELPARPYIGINQEDMEEARETISLFLQQGLKGK